MNGRKAKPKAGRSIVGVLLVGVLVSACGSKAHRAAPAKIAPASSSVVAASTAATSPSAASVAPVSQSAPASSARPTSAAGPTAASPSPASPSTASPSTAAQVDLAAGQVGTRAQVPWGQVGPGWFLVLSDSPAVWKGSESAPPPPIGTLTIWLISPAGALYAVSSWSETGSDPRNLAELVAWSGDGRHALFNARSGAVEEDLTTGALRQVTVPHLITVGFTSPTGANLVADEDVSTADGTSVGDQLERLDLDGKPQVLLAETYRTETRWLYSADGVTVYLNSWGGLRAVGNGGGPARALGTFEAANNDCAPVSWWDQSTVLANCTDLGGNRLWLVPVNGGAATALTGVPGSDSVGLGYDNAVRVSGTVFAEHQEGCGVTSIHRLAPSGVGTRIAIPQSLSNDRLIGAVGDRLAIESASECGSPEWFGFYDPATNALQTIIPAGPGELGAGSALAFP